MRMPIRPSGAGTGFGSTRHFATGTSRRLLPSIRCPILAIQGEDDEYGTMEQIESIAAIGSRHETAGAAGLSPFATSRSTRGRARRRPANSSPSAAIDAGHGVRQSPTISVRAPLQFRTLCHGQDQPCRAAPPRSAPKPRRADPQDAAYLRMLADKIRDARAQRGMTRNALAADSGVSLRFLAQLESGQGNPSILVLRRIASAMGFPPDSLLSDDPPPAIDRILLTQMLKRLPDDDIAKVRRLLTQHLASTRSPRPRNPTSR